MGLTDNSTARTPTAAQVTQLKSLLAAAATAEATAQAAYAAWVAANTASLEANKAAVNYQSQIYGYRNPAGVISGDANL